MFDKIEFEPSAYKHGISEEDVGWCILHREYIKIKEFYPVKKVLFIGWSTGGLPLEVAAKDIEGDLIVYHAMKLRKNWYHLIYNQKQKRRNYGNGRRN
jgi:hypothetical protein